MYTDMLIKNIAKYSQHAVREAFLFQISFLPHKKTQEKTKLAITKKEK